KIEFDNPGTKDIYATPLKEIKEKEETKKKSKPRFKPSKFIRKRLRGSVKTSPKAPKSTTIKKRRFKRTGTSSDFNWKTLSDNLENKNYNDPKSKQRQILNFFLEKSNTALNFDSQTAEAIAAIASDLMKGSKGGRHFLREADKKVKESQQNFSFHQVFSGDKALYQPAKSGGRKLVTDMTSEIELEANRVLGDNNCLFNAIALAAGRRLPNLGELMRIRERIGSFGNSLYANHANIAIIRDVLGIHNDISVIYPPPKPSEDFPGTNNGPTLLIYHVNGNHFTHIMPNLP
ncbi:MAG: hypothetical protein AAF617_02355, partial [Bacteroidota bacterium]